LTWFLSKIDLQAEKIHVAIEDDAASTTLDGLPFIESRPEMFLPGAALFLSSIFGHHSDPDVLTLYQWLSSEGIKNKGLWFDEASTHNVFRAMVVHPAFAKDKATLLAVAHLAALQSDSGTWDHDSPFYQTVNALAHLDIHQAEIQLKKALGLLIENQNSDGTWSPDSPEWNIFLTIHALKNKRLLYSNRRLNYL